MPAPHNTGHEDDNQIFKFTFDYPIQLKFGKNKTHPIMVGNPTRIKILNIVIIRFYHLKLISSYYLIQMHYKHVHDVRINIASPIPKKF